MENELQHLLNEGVRFAVAGDFDNAFPNFITAQRKYPQNEFANANLGLAYFDTGNTLKAIEYFENTLKINPNNKMVINNLFLLYRLSMNFKGAERVGKILDKSGIEEPLISLFKDEDPEKNLLIAKTRCNFINPNPGIFKGKIKKGKKLRIGYLSYDFRLHPMAQLIEGLFRNHDKEKFEIIAISLGPNDRSIWRRKIEKSVSRFVDLSNLPDANLFEHLKNLNLDILVDLGGHTSGSRQFVLSLKPAPVIVNFLGFAGSMGSKYHDYIIADSKVIKKNEEKLFSENIVYMPDTYYPTNDKWIIPKMKYRRRDFGLPENAIVFASFVQTLKINQETLTLWLKVLKQVPNSVLWLLKQYAGEYDNTYAYVKKMGINPECIIYSDELPKFEHIARLKLADILLDSLVYGAHTTTVEGLWAGVPTITIYGKHLSSRTPSSILMAADLPELVTKSEKEFIACAKKYAKHPQMLISLKQKIAKSVAKTALFNCGKYAQYMEKAYQEMHKQTLNGKRKNILL